MEQNTAAVLISWGKALLSRAGLKNASREAEILLAHSMKTNWTNLLTRLQEPVRDEVRGRFQELVQARSQRRPLQYLTGIQQFMGLDFFVNEAVLIPRWDTERLVELALKKLTPLSAPLVVDVGTGSGAIAVSLARYCPRGRYFAVDISPAALEVAKRNAGRHQVEDKITFLPGNLLTPFLTSSGPAGEARFDLIVSNPPYIPAGEISQLPGDVRQEPRIALDGGKDGLECYRALLPQAQRLLRPGGHIFLEIGCTQGEDVTRLCTRNGFSSIRVFRDYEDRDRVACACLGKIISGEEDGHFSGDFEV